MTADNQSYLRFSVEESVWFQRGQEVEDLVSISLYPDIMIEEHNQYVTIRGALQLTGEYRIDEKGTHENERYQENTYGRLVNEVNTREDGISELKHRFPVDITIPKNRIQNLDDVYVSIDSFDYELPGNRCLQLIADLSISGIYNNQRKLEQEESPKTWEPEDAQKNNAGKMEMEEVFEEEVDGTTLFKYEDDEYKVFEATEKESNHEFILNNFLDVEDVEEDEDEELFTTIEIEARREAYQEDENQQRFNAKSTIPQFEMKSRTEEKTWNYSNLAESKNSGTSHTFENNHVVESFEKADVNNDTRDENALYLTKIFAKEDSQDFSRLKMYIVQTGDSLDTISERYHVTAQQLLKVNRLDQDRNVQDGQILYIPLQEKSKLFS